MTRIVTLLWFWAMLPLGLTAQDVPGTSNGAFSQAREIWLEGRDLEALRELGTLSRDGNLASKILLSRIADTPRVSQHLRQRLSRKDRVALFRDPSAPLGYDWLRSAARSNGLARALWDPQSGQSAALDHKTHLPVLVAHGELRATLPYLDDMTDRGNAAAAARFLQDNLSQFGPAGEVFLLGVRAHQSRQSERGPMTQLSQVSATAFAVNRSDLGRFAAFGQWPQPAPSAGIKARMVRTLPELTPLVQFCSRACSFDRQNICLASAAGAIARTGAFPYPLSSPAPSLIDDATYWAAPRFESDLARMLLDGDWAGC